MQSMSKHSHYTSINVIVAYGKLLRLFVLLLALLILGSRFTIASISTHSVKNTKFTSAQSDGNQKPSAYLLTSLADSESIWLYESIAAEEEEDEYKKLNSVEFRSAFLNKLFCSEVFIASYFRTRLQQLNLQKNAQPFVSYFVLYHSWKSHLV